MDFNQSNCNMTKILFLPLICLFFTNVSIAQQDCACCTEMHQQFDFWVGDWIVSDTSGNVVGENTIVKLEDECIVSEHWRGVAGLTGRSYNYYNQADSTWNQLWIDSSGSNLVLKGHAAPGKMILQSELQQGEKVDWYYNRITWTKNEDGSVTQLWEILDKNEGVLAVAFNGIYWLKE